MLKNQQTAEPKLTLSAQVIKIIIHPEGDWAEVTIHDGVALLHRQIRIPRSLRAPGATSKELKVGDRLLVTITLDSPTAN